MVPPSSPTKLPRAEFGFVQAVADLQISNFDSLLGAQHKHSQMRLLSLKVSADPEASFPYR